MRAGFQASKLDSDRCNRTDNGEWLLPETNLNLFILLVLILCAFKPPPQGARSSPNSTLQRFSKPYLA
eukprot:397509-Amphidinium_carterae.1